MDKEKIHLLYLDPEPHNLHAFSALFRRKAEYECHTCSREEEAIAWMQRYPVHILLADQPKPESTGMGFLVRIPAGSQPLVKIVLTAQRELGVLDKAVMEGLITAYFSKPVDFEKLERWMEVVSGQWSEKKMKTIRYEKLYQSTTGAIDPFPTSHHRYSAGTFASDAGAE